MSSVVLEALFGMKKLWRCLKYWRCRCTLDLLKNCILYCIWLCIKCCYEKGAEKFRMCVEYMGRGISTNSLTVLKASSLNPTETENTCFFKDLKLNPVSLRFIHCFFKLQNCFCDDEFWFSWYVTLEKWQGTLENYGRVYFGEGPFSICKSHQVHSLYNSELKWKLIYGNQSSPLENTHLENTTFI